MPFKEPSLDVWYYPWSTAHDGFLKKSILYFDHVSISSELPFSDGPNRSYGTDAAIQSLYEERERILKLIGAPLDSNDSFMTPEQGVLDRVNALLRFRSEVEPLVSANVLDLAPELTPVTSIKEIEEVTRIQEELSRRIAHLDPSSYGITPDEVTDDVSACIVTHVVAGDLSGFVDPLAQLKDALGSVALGAHLRGKVPITNDERVSRFLGDIMMATNELGKSERSEGRSRTTQQSARGALAATVIDEYLPDFGFQSYEDVLEAREKLSDELLAFRSYLSDLTHRMSAEPHTPAFKEELHRLSANTVRRAIRDLEHKVKSSKRKLFLSLAQNVVSAAPVSLATIAYPSCPPLVLWAVAVGILSAIDISRLRVDSSQINDVGFLLSSRDL